MCCRSVATVLRKTNPWFHSGSLGKNNAVTLLSQAQVQHLYKYLLLVAVTYKAVLQLRKKKEYRNSAAGARTQMTLAGQEAGRRGKVFGEESSAAAQGM